MGNPYYVAPDNQIGETLGKWTDRFIEQKYRDATLQQQADQLAELKLQDYRKSYGQEPVQGVAPPTQTLQAQQVAQQQQQIDMAKRKEDPRSLPWGEDKVTKLVTGLTMKGYPASALSIIQNNLMPAAKDQSISAGGVADITQEMWPEWRQTSADDLHNHATKIAEQIAKLPEGDPKRTELTKEMNKTIELQGIIGQIPQEKAKEFLFPEIARYEHESKAAMTEASMAARATMAAPDRQYVIAKKALYKQQGLDEATATAKAVEDLYTQEARKVKDGKIGNNGGIPSLPSGISGTTAIGDRNDGALQGLTPTQQSTVKAIVDYKFPVTNLRNKEMMALVQRAYQYDPTFDAKEYQTRAGVRKDFTSGKASQTVLSLNTAVGHLNSLSKAAEGLENGSVQAWNTFRNALTTKLSNDSRVTRFNTATNAVAGELATVFKNTSGTDQEIKSWHDKISSSQTPGQLRDNINEVIGLVGSRLEALHNKYEQGMGKKADFQLLSPKSRKILTGLGVDVNQFDPATNAPNSNMPAFDVKVPAGAKTMKIGRFNIEVQ